MGRRMTPELTRAVVLDACERLIAEGVYPSVERVRSIARICKHVVEDVRATLIAEGAIDVAGMPYAVMVHVDDPTADRPGDPDADEIRARIEAARAVKEAEVRPENQFVMRGRWLRPRPRSSQSASM